ncbi:phosphotransferase [Brevibacillus borstelensis]|uniref:phosphotransferase n=1 Tax=Brevibacillus borstelensis TaxID=45462 RepID=UPI0030BF620A
MDFHPDNLLYAGAGPVVIDWMTAVRGNPFADVARTVVMLAYASLPQGLPEPVKQGIMAVRKQFETSYLEAYLRSAKGSMDDVEQWYLPIMAARLCESIPLEEKDVLAKEIQQRLAVL